MDQEKMGQQQQQQQQQRIISPVYPRMMKFDHEPYLELGRGHDRKERKSLSEIEAITTELSDDEDDQKGIR